MRRRGWIFVLAGTVCASASLADAGNPHGEGFDLECSLCHTVDDWRPLRSPLEFDHASTGFPLAGAHGDAGCRDCHESLELSRVGTACGDCHADPHAGELGFDCQVCHDTTTWENQRAAFDAHAATLFPLLAPHAALDCEACHGGQRADQFATTPTDCYTCHLRDYTSTTDPNHVAAGFPTECETCHNPVSSRWDEAVFLHSAAFPLDGAHARVDCEGCHASGFAGTPTDCESCHLKDYQATTEPAHAAAGFPLECEVCHDTRAWTPALFNHDASRFPLRGQHRALDCESCHASGFTGTPTECFACHRADYQGARDPDHAGAGFPTACETCHDENGWEGAEFNHAATGFALHGAHQSLGCESCHASGYAGTPSDCFSCHRADYQGARDPDHAGAGFPTACETCHNENRWEGAEFNHAATGFALRGAHQPLGCDSCHASGYAGTPTECFACHRADYQGARDPDHAGAGFPTACETCHNENRWEGAVFNHEATGFLLRGAHQQLDCDACHDRGFAGTPRDCYSCHMADYRSTRDPNHVTAGFPTTCETCHNENRWEGATFDHNRTAFPLRDSHAGLDCEACHASGYAGTPTDCFSCHADDYNRTRDPNHQAAGFPTTCETCHRPTRWEDADWDHAQFFPIYTGTHRRAWNECADCHVAAGNFAVFECILCHAHGQGEMAGEHRGISRYRWESRACYECHPDGRADD